MSTRRIESPTNQLVKSLAALKERRSRDSSGTFLVEGRREAARAMVAGLEVLCVLHAPELTRQTSGTDDLVELGHNASQSVVELSAPAFRRISMRQNPDGFAVHLKRPDRSLGLLGDLDGGLVLVIDGVEKPGNIGAMLRTADAVGAAAVIVTGGVTDLENPNVVRASQGSVFTVPIAVAGAAAAAASLRASGHRIIATSPAGTGPHWDASYAGSVAVLVGSEDAGLSATWLAAADLSVSIPMRAKAADSLNVSVAAAVILFEALRQRSR